MKRILLTLVLLVGVTTAQASENEPVAPGRNYSHYIESAQDSVLTFVEVNKYAITEVTVVLTVSYLAYKIKKHFDKNAEFRLFHSSCI